MPDDQPAVILLPSPMACALRTPGVRSFLVAEAIDTPFGDLVLLLL